MLPLWAGQVYLTFTVLLFAFGPWPWPVANPAYLYGFLILVQLSLWVGYVKSIQREPGRYTGPIGGATLARISLFACLVWIVPTYIVRMGSWNSFSLTTAVDAGLLGLSDPAEMYSARLEALKDVHQTPLLAYLTMLISPLLWLGAPLGIRYWARLGLRAKLSLIAFIVADLFSWIAIGTNKGLADFLVVVPWLMLAATRDVAGRIHLRRAIAIIVFIVVGAALFMLFFTRGQEQRGEGGIRTYDEAAGIRFDSQHPLVTALPAGSGSWIAAFSSYLTQGYYALGLSLKEPFVWSFGVGNSYFFTGLVESFAGRWTISDRTYPARIEARHGYDRFARWHSVYPWLASDVGFLGTLMVVLLIGRLMAILWRETLVGENPLAVGLFALVVLAVAYFPANNQVLAFSSTATPFVVLLPVWLFTRRKHARVPKA